MGLFDYVRLNHPLFGEDRGHCGQTKEFPNPYMETYEITEAGRLIHEDVKYEDHSDPNAESGSLESIRGLMTPVKTGTNTDQEWHGWLWVLGKGDYHWKCKFTDGQLVSAEKVDA